MKNGNKKMKEQLPNFIFLHADNESFDSDILNNMDFIFFYTNYLSHKLYYKVINIARERNINVDYIQNTNDTKVINTVKSKILNTTLN